MGVLNDVEIRKLAHDGMISPFVEGERRAGKISYGLTSYGYDFRLGDDFQIFTGFTGRGSGPLQEVQTIDPKRFSSDACHEVQAWEDEDGSHVIVIPPQSFVLGVSLEKFHIPRNILGICLGKSTYARCGITLPITPLEPEWRGYLTVEMCNTTRDPVKIYAREGIGQLVFLSGNDVCAKSYADREGKYQDQPRKPVFPKVL